MSGAGSSDAGSEDAGAESSTVATSSRVLPPHALYFDPAVMDFTADEDGHYQSVHPVDSKAEIAWSIAFGSSASAPTVGNTLRELKLGPRARMSADALEIARNAVADMIAAGDLAIVSVVAYAANAWRAVVTITYQNLRAPDADRNRTVTLP